MAAAPATAGLLTAGNYVLAFALFVLAGLSDAADGFLAKRYGLTTRFGRYLDPAADKALMLAAFITLAALHQLPVWLALLVIGRDVFIIGGLLVLVTLHAPIAVQPLFVGKLSTALQVLYIATHLAAPAFHFSLRGLTPADAYIIAVVTLASAASYLWVGVRALRGLAASPHPGL